MAVQQKHQDSKTLRDLPCLERAQLCKILNEDKRWEELGYRMQFKPETINSLKNEQNPTDKLLTLWGQNDPTVMNLFAFLLSMEHHPAMVQLKCCLTQTYHLLIDAVEYNIRQKSNQNKGYENSKQQKIEVQTFNQNVPQAPVTPKIVASVTRKNSHKIPSQPTQILLRNETAPRKIRSPSSKDTKEVLEIPYRELKIATNKWSSRNILGRGGFGFVYKGTWNNTAVAIKKASLGDGSDPHCNYQSLVEQALKEIDILSSCHHDNIVTLYGCSFFGKPPCLVYELMPNGSLSHRLRLKDGTKALNWMERLNIAKGTAQGLLYLHTIGNRPLIHGDIKSSNILLDKFLEPKIGDFGMALTGPEPGSIIRLNSVGGTRPYLADDFLRDKLLSTKVDVYSFGVVLFELATGLRSCDESRKQKYLKNYVDSWVVNLIALQDTKAGFDQFGVYTKLMLLGKWCSLKSARHRPEISQVLPSFNMDYS